MVEFSARSRQATAGCAWLRCVSLRHGIEAGDTSWPPGVTKNVRSDEICRLFGARLGTWRAQTGRGDAAARRRFGRACHIAARVGSVSRESRPR